MSTKSPSYWFFIRGLMREAAHWEDFPKTFESAFPGTKVVLIDLPGNGQHWNSKSPLTVSEMANSIRLEVRRHLEPETRKLGKNPKCFVLAISLGGMVALEWLQRFPEEVSGGVFINISLSGVNPFYQRLKPKAWMPLLDIAFTRDIKNRERKVLDLTTSHFPAKESSLLKRVEAYQKHPSTKLNFVRQLIAASRFRPKLTQIKPPVLLLNSLGDRLVDSDCSSVIQTRWNLELKTHPTANHDLPLEDPQWVISQVREWLNSHRLSASA